MVSSLSCTLRCWIRNHEDLLGPVGFFISYSSPSVQQIWLFHTGLHSDAITNYLIIKFLFLPYSENSNIKTKNCMYKNLNVWVRIVVKYWIHAQLAFSEKFSNIFRHEIIMRRILRWNYFWFFKISNVHIYFCDEQ